MKRIAAGPRLLPHIGDRTRPGPEPDEAVANRQTRLGRRPRHGMSGTRVAAAILATGTLALVATACGNGPSSAGSGGSVSNNGSKGAPSPVAFSACMRSKGVPNYPDPDSSGQLPKGGAQQFDVSTDAFQAAQKACRHLLPTGGSLQQQAEQCGPNDDCPQSLVQLWMSADLKLARCMRSHGVPNFPDPTNGGASGPYFDISKVGISDAESHASGFVSKLNECGRLVGDYAPESFG